MSELIKENRTESMITMVPRRTFSQLALIFMAVLLLSTVQYVTANDSNFMLSQTDTRAPNIYGWGIEGEPELGNGFDVWANVTDDEPSSGIRNVTVEVNGPNMTLINLLTFNGTFYTGSVPAFPNDGTFNARIRTYDMENNTRNSYSIQIVFSSDPPPIADPSVTMPVVVGSSLGLMVVVIGLAMIYDKKRSAGERVSHPENSS
ncbi:MAG: hypothetical protein ACXACG_05865 [Candidatus Thorarchaeota archaeon]|jgi:hypothetical protein